jgi:Arc/MetJ family transcription regulator
VRTTITLDDDVAAAVERERRRHGGGLSETVNRLIRRGLHRPQRSQPFVQRTQKLGLRIDVSNVAEALEQLEGPGHR